LLKKSKSLFFKKLDISLFLARYEAGSDYGDILGYAFTHCGSSWLSDEDIDIFKLIFYIYEFQKFKSGVFDFLFKFGI
jgi:hypothetical protein